MDWLNVGKIVNTHGIRGEVRVISRTDFPEERYKVGSQLAIFKKKSKTPIPVTVASHRKHKNFDLLTFEGHPNINDVEQYRDAILKVSTQYLQPLPEGEYYHFQIIGCHVQSIDGEPIGEITQVVLTGANDVWEVKDASGKLHYIPYIDDVVKRVDIDNKLVTIEVMEGLL